jgi:hypothetical protein
LFAIGVEVAVTKEMLDVGGADSALSGAYIVLGVVSPVIVEMELPEGDEALKVAWGGRRSLSVT